jgi:protein O-mannosyl-transferase
MILGMEEGRSTDTMTLWLTAGGIALLAMVTFAPAIRGEFFFDDEILIVKNPRVTEPGGVWESWTTLKQPDYYPVTSSLFWLQWRLWGPQTGSYHVVGILLHCLSSVLVWRVLVRLKVPGAIVAALLFAVHPTGAESVGWISEQKNTVAMVFFLLTILAWLKFDDGEGLPWYAAALGLFCAALLSKAAVVMLPAALLLVAWWRAGRPRDGRDGCDDRGRELPSTMREYVLQLAPFFAASGAAAWAAMHTQEATIGTMLGRPEGEGFFTQLAASGMAVWFYLSKSLLPIRLALVYPRWEIHPGSVLSYVPTAAVIATLAGLWLLRRWAWARAAFVALAVFVVLLFPLLGFFDNAYWAYSRVADRYVYFSLIAVAALAAAGGAKLLGALPRPFRRAGMPVAAVVVAALAVLAGMRANLFGHPQELWRDTAEKYPTAWIARENYAKHLGRQGRYAEAAKHVAYVYKVRPDRPDSVTNYGVILHHLGRSAEGLAYLETSIRKWPGHLPTCRNLAIVLMKLGRYDEAAGYCNAWLRREPDSVPARIRLGRALRKARRYDEAIEAFEDAARLEPDNANIRHYVGTTWAARGDLGRAVAEFRSALQLAPDHLPSRGDLGRALRQMGAVDEAIAVFREILRTYPDEPQAHLSLALALIDKGETAAAIREYREVLRCDADHVDALNSLAWLLATHADATFRDGADAVRLGERVCELTKRSEAALLDTLAAAYAEAGRFDDAVRTAAEAEALAARTAPRLVDEIRTRKELYATGKPFRILPKSE